MSVLAVSPALLAGRPLPRHQSGDDKEARGRVLVIGGSIEMPGAALLSGIAALRAGAGKLQFAVCESIANQLTMAAPEARVYRMAETTEGGISGRAAPQLQRLAADAAAVVVGPGMVDEEATAAIVDALLEDSDGPALLLDAGALRGLPDRAAALARRGGRVVITPHAGEMASCLDLHIETVEADPLAIAQRAAAELGVIVALKGGCTRIAAPSGEAFTCDRGNVGLATSGSGDVLAGVIGGLLARGASPLDACLWGVFAHGEAGARAALARGPIGYLARELPGEIPAILGEYAPR